MWFGSVRFGFDVFWCGLVRFWLQFLVRFRVRFGQFQFCSFRCGFYPVLCSDLFGLGSISLAFGLVSVLVCSGFGSILRCVVGSVQVWFGFILFSCSFFLQIYLIPGARSCLFRCSFLCYTQGIERIITVAWVYVLVESYTCFFASSGVGVA